jgi:phage baseplate assembly protein W
MANIYRGFSTIGKIRPPYTLTDGELIKTDLLNELKAKKGERVMRPSFGTRIEDMLMNPLDKFLVQEVEDEVRRVVEKDSRVELQDIFTEALDHTVKIVVNLKILPFLDEEVLYLDFARNNTET